MEENRSNRNKLKNKKRRWNTIKTNNDLLKMMSSSHLHNNNKSKSVSDKNQI